MNRYTVVKTVHRVWGFIPIYTAGVRRSVDNQMVYVGHEKDCVTVARELNTAYRDGKFASETGRDDIPFEGM